MPQNLTYNDLKAEFRISSSGDSWGECMSWWFTTADEIYFHRAPRLRVPASWRFRPSPLGLSNEPDRYETITIEAATDEALERFGTLLTRYASKLKIAKRDY